MKKKLIITTTEYTILPWYKIVKPIMKIRVWDYNLDKYKKRKMFVEIKQTMNEIQITPIENLEERENG